SIFRESFIGVAIGLVGALGAIFFGMKFLPETKVGRRLILEEAISAGAALEPVSEEEEAGATITLVGQVGETTTDLVPSGKGRFGSQLLDIVSDGEFISKGSPVEITLHEGSRIVVAKA
ncbi:MAG: NfeD family protein, partial [Verrucomicrobiota bacterium]